MREKWREVRERERKLHTALRTSSLWPSTPPNIATQTEVFRFQSLRAWSEGMTGLSVEHGGCGLLACPLTFAGREEELCVLWVDLQLINGIAMAREGLRVGRRERGREREGGREIEGGREEGREEELKANRHRDTHSHSLLGMPLCWS